MVLKAATIAVLISFIAAAHAPVYANGEQLEVLIIDGRNNHEWEKTTPALRAMLQSTERFAVDVHTAAPEKGGKTGKSPIQLTTQDLEPYDCILTNYNGPRWSPETEKAVETFVREGKGLAVLHAANNCHQAWPEYQKMLGYNWRGSGHGPKFLFDVHITDTKHLITNGVPDFWHNKDELYHLLKLNPKAKNTRVLATAFSPPRTIQLKRKKEDGSEYVTDHCFGTGNEEPVVVITDYGKGRCFHMILGHYAESLQDNGFKTLMTRGVEWAACGNVTLPVIEPIPPAKRLPCYPEPQVVVEGLEQHLTRKEYDRLPGLFAGDKRTMADTARKNADAILALISRLRIPKTKWQTQNGCAVWALPDHKPGVPWWRIQCVKEGREWQIRSIE